MTALRPWGQRIGEAGLHLLCLCAFLAPAGAATGLGLLVLGFILAPPRRSSDSPLQALPLPPAVAIAVGLAAFVLVHTAWVVMGDPAAAPDLWRAAGAWLALLIFVPFGWFLAQGPTRIWRLLGLTLVGLIGGILWRLDWAALMANSEAYLGSRPGFGFPTIAFALYAGTAILGLVFLARRWWAPGPSRVWRVGLWALALVLLVEGFLIAQSRGSWIALVVALPLGGALAWRLGSQQTRTQAPRHRGLLLAAALVAIGGLVIANGGLILERLSAELDTLDTALEEAPGDRPRTSLELRLRAQVFGLTHWSQRPWLGWGAGSSNPLMEADGDPGLREEGLILRHLHNAYLELLVQFGVLGALLAAALMASLILGVWQALGGGRCPPDLGVFLLAAFAFLLIWSLWSYRALHQDWRIYWVLLAGTALAVSLAPAWGSSLRLVGGEGSRRSDRLRLEGSQSDRLRLEGSRPSDRLRLEEEASAPPRRILLVRLSAIGDVVFASALVGAFRRAYPEAHLAWLVQPECRPLLEHHPDLDEVLVWPHGEWRKLWRHRRLRDLWRAAVALRADLRRQGFDLAIDLQGLLKSGALTWLSGAPRRIGLGSREGSQWLMTQVIPRAGDPRRIGSEYRHLAETLGLPLEGFAMGVHYGAEDLAHAEALMESAGLRDGFAALCPFTTRPQKHWIEGRWAELATALEAGLGLPSVILGGPGDRAAAARILGLAGGRPIDLAGQTTLPQAAALLHRADLVVAVDTGLGHMAIALRRPSLLLFGSTRPYLDTGRPEAKVLYHPLTCSPCRRRPTCGGAFTCMGLIGVAEVLAAARELLGRPPP